MVAAEPQIFLRTLRADEFHPFLHHGEVAGKQVFVAVSTVKFPRADDRCVAPCGGNFGSSAGHFRHNAVNAAVRVLLRHHIVQPFRKEPFDIIIDSRRADKDLRVAQPTEPFVALRAVGRNVDEVAPLSPERVPVQAVDLLVPAEEETGLFHVGADRHGDKVFGADLLSGGEFIDPDVAVTLKGEMRLEDARRAVQHIGVAAFGKLQIFGVEVALAVERFGVGKRYAVAGSSGDGDFHVSGKVLPEVDHGLALRCAD